MISDLRRKSDARRNAQRLSDLFDYPMGAARGDGTIFALNLSPAPEPSTFVLLVTGAIRPYRLWFCGEEGNARARAVTKRVQPGRRSSHTAR